MHVRLLWYYDPPNTVSFLHISIPFSSQSGSTCAGQTDKFKSQRSESGPNLESQCPVQSSVEILLESHRLQSHCHPWFLARLVVLVVGLPLCKRLGRSVASGRRRADWLIDDDVRAGLRRVWGPGGGSGVVVDEHGALRRLTMRWHL